MPSEFEMISHDSTSDLFAFCLQLSTKKLETDSAIGVDCMRLGHSLPLVLPTCYRPLSNWKVRSVRLDFVIRKNVAANRLRVPTAIGRL
jgi:hypothetical protein